MKTTNDVWTGPVPYQADAARYFLGPVPNWNCGCRNADAGSSFRDADAQLWALEEKVKGLVSQEQREHN